MDNNIEIRAVSRLLKHAQLVQRIMLGLSVKLNLNKREVLERALRHDGSKFMPDMYAATLLCDVKDYHDRDLNDAEAESLVEWTRLHYAREWHHPNHYDDINKMSDLDVIEMVCDWTAMAVELKNPNLSAKWFADKVIGSRFIFNSQKIKQIYRLIDEADEVVQTQRLSTWFD